MERDKIAEELVRLAGELMGRERQASTLMSFVKVDLAGFKKAFLQELAKKLGVKASKDSVGDGSMKIVLKGVKLSSDGELSLPLEFSKDGESESVVYGLDFELSADVSEIAGGVAAMFKRSF